MVETVKRFQIIAVVRAHWGTLVGSDHATQNPFKEREKEMSARSMMPAVMALVVSLALASTIVAKEETILPPPGPQSPCAEACDCEPICCPTNCERGLQVYGDLLYLRPRNDGLEYAVPINGPITPGTVPVQVGRTASLDPQIAPGFRVGGGIDFDCCSNLSATFTYYACNVDDSISTDAPFVLRSMVVHPSTADAAYDWLSATAHEAITFNIADIDYRHQFYCSERSSLTYLVGLRYANLKQDFSSQFEPIITENVDASVDFDGGGFRLGLEGVRYSACRNIFIYGKAAASFLGGEFRADYLQSNANNPLVAATDWKEARMVSILDCEVGLGWASEGGHVRISAGYMVSGWLNVVKTPEFIASVQANQYHGPDKIDGNALVFDGLVSRLEFRW